MCFHYKQDALAGSEHADDLNDVRDDVCVLCVSIVWTYMVTRRHCRSFRSFEVLVLARFLSLHPFRSVRMCPSPFLCLPPCLEACGGTGGSWTFMSGRLSCVRLLSLCCACFLCFLPRFLDNDVVQECLLYGDRPRGGQNPFGQVRFRPIRGESPRAAGGTSLQFESIQWAAHAGGIRNGMLQL